MLQMQPMLEKTPRFANKSGERDYSINERAQDVFHNTLELDPFELLALRDVNRISFKIINLLAKQFRQIASHDNRQDVLMKVLQHDTIITIVPKYYPKLHEAKTQLSCIQDFREELCQVKRPQSNNVLACKIVLLDAIISTHIACGMVGISRLQGTKRWNLERAIERCHSFKNLGASQWAIFRQKKRFDGLSKETKVVVILWWISETKVNLNTLTRKMLCASALVQNTMRKMQHIFCQKIK